jgi:hypothetical protein
MQAITIKIADIPLPNGDSVQQGTVQEIEQMLRTHYSFLPNLKDVSVKNDQAILYFEGVSDEELLRSKSVASILYLLDTLKRFQSLSLDKIREIGFEIGLLANHGVEFDDAKKRYNLRTLPGEKFTGLQLMCLMYAAFKAFEPTLDIGIDLENEYGVAKKLSSDSRQQ